MWGNSDSGRSLLPAAGIEEAAESRDGLVVATVAGSGELCSLWLDPRIYQVPDAEGLAAGILDAVRAAAESAQRRVFAAAAPLLPQGVTFDDTDLIFDPALHMLDQITKQDTGIRSEQ